MGNHDTYQFGRTGPLGKISFGDKTYSDQFVRTETTPLAAKKKTQPLQITGDLVSRMIDQADDQLRTCRIIVDKFNQRMRILQWAEEVSRSPDLGAAEPEPEPEPQPARPEKKGLLGLKKPGPGAGAKPGTAKPGMARPTGLGARNSSPGAGGTAQRAEKVPKGVKTSVQLNAQEQALGLTISRAIARNPDMRRRVQIAVYQYQMASQAVADGEKALADLRSQDPQDAFNQLEALDVAKIQGKIYPICNFHEVFKGDAELVRLFPPPAKPGQAGVPPTTA